MPGPKRAANHMLSQQNSLRATDDRSPWKLSTVSYILLPGLFVPPATAPAQPCHTQSCAVRLYHLGYNPVQRIHIVAHHPTLLQTTPHKKP